MKNISQRMVGLSCVIVKAVGCSIFAFLLWYSFRYTHHQPPELWEVSLVVRDSALANAAFAGMGILLFGLIVRMEKKLSDKTKKTIADAVAVVAVAWMLFAGFMWIYSATRYPITDPQFTFAGASYFIEGQYSFLGKGGYCGFFPHQLGLIFFMELFFRCVGTFQYFKYEIMCVFLAAGVVWLGYLILRHSCNSLAAAVAYSCSMMCCIPLIVYTSWVYGDIPCLFFTMLAAWCLECYADHPQKIAWLAGAVISVVWACIVRKHAAMFVIAFCLAALVTFWQKRDKKILVAAALAAILPTLAYQGINKMYEMRSGIEHSKGLPVNTWLAIGLTESAKGEYGVWVDDFRQYYFECEFDIAKVREKAAERIRERIGVMQADPAYAMRFYREKILTQWNDPLCGCFYFNTQYNEADVPAADSWPAKVMGDWYDGILTFCSRIQAFVYLGVFFYYLFAVRKDAPFLWHIVAITIIGGFLFSILWEAKTRYIFSYYPLMFPMAATGYFYLIQTIQSVYSIFS